jgi:type IX secretion system PorP/SprF family membrane protein
MEALKKTLLMFVFIYIGGSSMAQQDAMYTHYMYNTLSVNPAYAGSRDVLTATVLHRSQWTDFKGAPQSQTFTLHTPLKSRHIGLGLSGINDQAGPVHSTGVYADFAYIMKLNEKSHLSLGVKGGFTMMQIKLNSLALDDQSDQAFQNNVTSELLPNFGFGIYYFRERFYAGVSTPKLMENNFKTNTSNGSVNLASEQRHYYFIAGTQLKITESIEFKPTTFVKVTNAAPAQADLTASFIFSNRLLTGFMIRSGDALGVLVGITITDQFHVGYSYDWSYGNKTFKYNGGSHELMLSYDFIFKDKARIRSPRYF